MACKFACEVGLVGKAARKPDFCEAMRALQQPLRSYPRACLGHDVAAAQAAFGQRPLQAAAGQARVLGQCIHRVLCCRVLQHMARQLVRQRWPGQGVAQVGGGLGLQGGGVGTLLS